MEIAKKEVIRSSFYFDDIKDINEFSEATFGERTALNFYDDLKIRVRLLETQFLMHPECLHLETKSKKYRNIILGSYLIIYRITKNQIEVLRAFHGSRSQKSLRKLEE